MVKTLTYKTNINIGNMEHKSLEISYDVGEDENVEDVFVYIKDLTHSLLNPEKSKPAISKRGATSKPSAKKTTTTKTSSNSYTRRRKY